jgi:hypothetical protein
MMFIEYKFPEQEVNDMGPHMSKNIRSKGRVARNPSLNFGTDDLVCLPMMHRSHFGGEVERLIGIPCTTLARAISTMVA